MRRIRELRAGVTGTANASATRLLRRRASDDERGAAPTLRPFTHRARTVFSNPAIEAEFSRARARVHEKLRTLHLLHVRVPADRGRLDLRMLSTWLRR